MISGLVDPLTVIPSLYNGYMDTLNISVLAKNYSDESAVYITLEEMRWPNGPECPHCGSVDHSYFLTPKNG